MRNLIFLLTVCLFAGLAGAQYIETPMRSSGSHVWTYTTNCPNGISSIVWTNAPGEPCVIDEIGLYYGGSVTQTVTVQRIRTDLELFYVGNTADTNGLTVLPDSLVPTNYIHSVTNVVTFTTTNTLAVLVTTNNTSVVFGRDGVNLDGICATANPALPKLSLRDYDVVVVKFGVTNTPLHIDITAGRY